MGTQTDNPYFRCFLHNISLRDCCYKCPYKGNNYYSDITLGDFWGARHVIPEIDDYQGVSLVLVRSEKAAGILDKVKREMIVYSVDEEKSLLQNVTIFSPTEMSPKRTVFLNSWRMSILDIWSIYWTLYQFDKELSIEFQRDLSRS